MILMVKHYPTTWHSTSILKWNGLIRNNIQSLHNLIESDENLSKSYLCHLKEIIFPDYEEFLYTSEIA